MSKKIKNVLIVLITLFVLIMIVVFAVLSRRIKKNDPLTIGNTAGNLNNNGLFCENNGTVYFSNPYDESVLYSMKPDETELKKLNSVGVNSINCDGTRLYYSQTGTASGSGLGYIRKVTGLYRCNLKGKNAACLNRDPIGIAALCGNFLYMQDYSTDTGTWLTKIGIDKKDKKTILTQMVNPSSIADGIIYFAGMDQDHYLYALDTATDTVTTIWKHNLYNPIYQNGIVYFMDLETDYELHSYDISSQTETTLSTDRLDFFNVYQNIIYYQKSSATDPALKRIYTDGTGDEIVNEGVFTNINITSHYVYYNEFKNPLPVFHQETFGPIQISTFDAAKELALKSK